ncbi:MAG: hypothetical protein P1V51_10325 [Deltaproteobacteria bacterium]|nr:hypothetical protein [Deltaproteobacteria bacterium]
MRAFLASLLVGMALSFAAPAFAQDVGRPPSTKLRSYVDENAPKKKEGLSAQAYLLITGLGCLTFLGLLVWFRAQTRELNIPEDEQALASQGQAGGGSGLSPKEAIFSALRRVDGWATSGRISMSSGVDSGTAESMLQQLVQEGRIKAGRDKRGRVLYRAD